MSDVSSAPVVERAEASRVRLRTGSRAAASRSLRAVAAQAHLALRECALLLVLVAAYLLARLLYEPARPPVDLAAMRQIGLIFGVCLLFSFPIRVLVEAARTPRAPDKAVWSSVRRWASTSRRMLTAHRVVGVVLVSLAVSVVYAVYLEWKADIGLGIPFTWDARLAALDRALHGGHHPWELLHPLLSIPAVTVVMDFLYHPLWGLVFVAVPSLMAWSNDALDRMRFFLVFAMAWIVLGTGVGYAFASAGPIYLERILSDDLGFAGLFEYLGSVHAATPLFSARAAESLWHAYVMDSWPRLGISAMPSMHLAMATLAALAAWGTGWLPRLLGLLFVTVVLAGSVHLGWHYAIDGYLSVAVICMAWWATGRMLARSPARHRDTGARPAQRNEPDGRNEALRRVRAGRWPH